MVYENDHAFAILDINPVSPGHTMVISKTHAKDLPELPKDEVGPLFEGVKVVLAKIQKALKPDGFTIGINQGLVSGQVVGHLHIHLIPRFAGDNGKSVHSVVMNPPNESLTDTAKKIREVQ